MCVTCVWRVWVHYVLSRWYYARLKQTLNLPVTCYLVNVTRDTFYCVHGGRFMCCLQGIRERNQNPNQEESMREEHVDLGLSVQKTARNTVHYVSVCNKYMFLVRFNQTVWHLSSVVMFKYQHMWHTSNFASPPYFWPDRWEEECEVQSAGASNKQLVFHSSSLL